MRRIMNNSLLKNNKVKDEQRSEKFRLFLCRHSSLSIKCPVDIFYSIFHHLPALFSPLCAFLGLFWKASFLRLKRVCIEKAESKNVETRNIEKNYRRNNGSMLLCQCPFLPMAFWQLAKSLWSSANWQSRPLTLCQSLYFLPIGKTSRMGTLMDPLS